MKMRMVVFGWMRNSNYYGELDYFLSYKGKKETPMKWLYLDFDTLNLPVKPLDYNVNLF